MPAADPKHQATIEKATHLFWQDGFEGVSIADVVQATGVNRYALYQVFGGKKGIFIAALDAYCDHAKDAMVTALARPGGTALEAIKTVVRQKITDAGMFHAGCLMTTTAVELAAKDEDVAARMQFYITELRALMTAAISRAQSEGDLNPTASTEGLMELMFNMFLGIGVQARMGIPQAQVLTCVDAAFDAITEKWT